MVCYKYTRDIIYHLTNWLLLVRNDPTWGINQLLKCIMLMIMLWAPWRPFTEQTIAKDSAMRVLRIYSLLFNQMIWVGNHLLRISPRWNLGGSIQWSGICEPSHYSHGVTVNAHKMDTWKRHDCSAPQCTAHIVFRFMKSSSQTLAFSVLARLWSNDHIVGEESVPKTSLEERQAW